MEVILLEKIRRLGDLGDKVKVKPGFGRNFLIPEGKAVPATPENIAKFEARRAELEKTQADALATAAARAEKLNALTLTIRRKAGEEGKLFGSVTNADVADRLNEQGLDFEIDRRWVHMDEPLKALGDFTVPVRLHTDVTVDVEVRVERAE